MSEHSKKSRCCDLTGALREIAEANKCGMHAIATANREIADSNRAVAAAIQTLAPKKPKVHLDLTFGLPKRKQKQENSMVEITITNEQKVNVALNPKTDAGKPATLDGAPTWSVIAGDSTVVPSADGLSADLISSDTPGDTTFLIDGDADLGEGKEDVQETITLHVAGANAKNLGVTVGTPVLK